MLNIAIVLSIIAVVAGLIAGIYVIVTTNKMTKTTNKSLKTGREYINAIKRLGEGIDDVIKLAKDTALW